MGTARYEQAHLDSIGAASTIFGMTQPRKDHPSTFIHPFAKPANAAAAYISIVLGEGSKVMDSKGRWYIDGLAGLWYCNVGHGRRELINAATAQMEELATFHSFDIFTNPRADELAERVSSLAPMAEARVFFTNSGSEAVDSAFKFARAAQAASGHPERTIIISRIPSYHGVTYGGMSATGLPLNHVGFGPLVGDVIQVPAHDLEALDAVLEVHGDRIAAVIAEPVIGAGGVHPARDGYLTGLRERCDRTGAYLIFDEVITGFGRLGSWWGAEHYGVRPDLVTFAKAVTSGYMPVGGVIVGPAVHLPLSADPSFIFRHGNTYAGHPTAAAVALANIEILEQEELIQRATHIGSVLVDQFGDLVDGSKILEMRGEGAIRALGLAEGLDAVHLRDLLLDEGVIVRAVGPATIAICPPLVISDDELVRMRNAFGNAVDKL